LHHRAPSHRPWFRRRRLPCLPIPGKLSAAPGQEAGNDGGDPAPLIDRGETRFEVRDKERPGDPE
jgi:hypothetical protein